MIERKEESNFKSSKMEFSSLWVMQSSGWGVLKYRKPIAQSHLSCPHKPLLMNTPHRILPVNWV